MLFDQKLSLDVLTVSAVCHSLLLIGGGSVCCLAQQKTHFPV